MRLEARGINLFETAAKDVAAGKGAHVRKTVFEGTKMIEKGDRLRIRGDALLGAGKQ